MILIIVFPGLFILFSLIVCATYLLLICEQNVKMVIMVCFIISDCNAQRIYHLLISVQSFINSNLLAKCRIENEKSYFFLILCVRFQWPQIFWAKTKANNQGNNFSRD